MKALSMISFEVETFTMRTILLTLPFIALTVPALGQDVQIPPFDACRAADNASLFKPLTDIKTTLVHDNRRMPPDCSEEFFLTTSRDTSPRFSQDRHYHWLAPNFYHWPAYYDDVPLERYGQSRFPHIQPFISGAKFILQTPMLPYKMGVDRPRACVTTLGHQPPGNCVPCIRQMPPKQADATVLQTAATVGLVFLLP